MVLLGIWIKGYAILFALISNLYPMWKSMLTLEDNDVEETNTWLCYWTVYAIIQLAQLFFGFILDFIPYFSIIQLVFYIWLMAPQTNGARTLYRTVFRDFLKEHKPALQKFFDSMEAQAENVAQAAADKAKEGVSNIDLNKAAEVANAARNMASDKKMD